MALPPPRPGITVGLSLHEPIGLACSPCAVPWPPSPDAQCGFLNTAGLVDGVCTEDSDVFLFGAKTVYKGLFGNEQNSVGVVTTESVAENVGLDRDGLVAMALLLGSDYTEGVANVGAAPLLFLTPFASPCSEFPCDTPKATVLAKKSAGVGESDIFHFPSRLVRLAKFMK